jgi:hypothetical protein
MVLSTTSIEPDVGQDWLYVHSPSVSALAGLANSANSIAGMIISQRERTSDYSEGRFSGAGGSSSSSHRVSSSPNKAQPVS